MPIWGSTLNAGLASSHQRFDRPEPNLQLERLEIQPDHRAFLGIDRALRGQCDPRETDEESRKAEVAHLLNTFNEDPGRPSRGREDVNRLR